MSDIKTNSICEVKRAEISTKREKRKRVFFAILHPFLTIPLLMYIMAVLIILFAGGFSMVLYWTGYYGIYLLMALFLVWALGVCFAVVDLLKSKRWFEIYKYGIEYRDNKNREFIPWAEITTIDIESTYDSHWDDLAVRRFIMTISTNDNTYQVVLKMYKSEGRRSLDKFANRFIKLCPFPELVERAKEILDSKYLCKIKEEHAQG